ncbi:hypothetical protein [Burkholderia mayonis]|uniref:Uncharacterized protein n=1 Tax=Burkholderia mayonis TaxID=1385591 RepID=A0A1B4FT75_9BURK|nr:hypothetical protein [Burkholderia mayonis]AOJ06883.1 hypothetical protein WS71_05795 [Burkholderia mayonis]KVE57598.1 hypothetical protein WS71_26030 [Burkholderia mayonis]
MTIAMPTSAAGSTGAGIGRTGCADDRARDDRPDDAAHVRYHVPQAGHRRHGAARRGIGQLAASLLIERIERDIDERRIVDVGFTLVERDSAQAAGEPTVLHPRRRGRLNGVAS